MDYYYDDADYMDLINDEADAEANGDGDYHDGLTFDAGTLSERLWESYEQCVVPSLQQIVMFVAPLLLGCLLYRIACALYAQLRSINRIPLASTLTPLHTLSAISGLGIVYMTVGNNVILLVTLTAASYALLQLIRIGSGQTAAVAITVITIGSQFVYETIVWRQPHEVRGLHMVANMKLISLAFDLIATKHKDDDDDGDNDNDKASMRIHQWDIPSPIAYLGYIYSPATCSLGPWVSYDRYVKSLRESNTNPHGYRFICHVLLNVSICLLALSMSNCIAPTIGDFQYMIGRTLTTWLLMYMGALSVRCSHYFITSLSQATLAVAGQKLDPSASESHWFGALVTRPWEIEWPRSISMLVRSWNLPMHHWLKCYIYTPIRRQFNGGTSSTILALIATYFISSLMHGMDARIYLVLLSLAVFASGETMLRSHLAATTDACVSANPCRYPACRYKHCPSRRGWRCITSWVVLITNFAFTLLAMFHLAYLGVVLLNNDSMEGGTEAATAPLQFLYHWSSTHYVNHYIVLGIFMVYMLIT